MGRTENRRIKKHLRKFMTQDQIDNLITDTNKKYLTNEIEKTISLYKKLWTECLLESFNDNGISKLKSKMILDDVELLMQRKVGEYNDERLKKAIS